MRTCPYLVCWLFMSATLCHGQEMVDFNRDVRPILSDRCYACHGPDAKSREAGLRLDKRESALSTNEAGTNEAGAAIVPGKPDLSELVSRIHSDDPDELMPPSRLNKPLTPEEKKILVRWIAQGAKYERHWSFTPPRRDAIPSVKKEEWPRNPIDHFLLARLEREKLSPSPEANRETLIRRVTLDLTGLPATPDEIDAFVRDTKIDAYERLVDRLMKTTAYAERRTGWIWRAMPTLAVLRMTRCDKSGPGVTG